MANTIQSSYLSSFYNSIATPYLNNYKSIYSLNAASSYSQIYNLLSMSSSSIAGGNYSVDYSALNGLSSLKSDAGALLKAASNLTSMQAFNKKTAVSSNTDALTVEAGSAYTPSSQMNITIEQLASGQINTGAKLDSAALASPGDYQVKIQIGGKSYTAAFKVNAGDTNKVMQQNFADAINKLNAPLSASVKADGNTTALSIFATGTGDSNANRFTITDYVGDAVAATAANSMDSDAKNAIYRIDNGAALTSASNTVALKGGVTATFKAVSVDSIAVSTAADSKYAASVVKDFVISFNSLLSNSAGSDSLSGDLMAFTRLYSSTLSSFGVSVSNSGALMVDDMKLNQAVENGTLRSFLTGSSKGYGLFSHIARIAGNVSRAPANYSSAFTDFKNSFYTNQNSLYASLLQSSRNSFMGMFLNSTV